MIRCLKLKFAFPVPNHCYDYKLYTTDNKIFITYTDGITKKSSEITCDLDPELFELATDNRPILFFDNSIYV